MTRIMNEDKLNYEGAMSDLKDLTLTVNNFLGNDTARSRLAWYMCANYGPDVLKHPEFEKIKNLARSHAPPPRGYKKWDVWFSALKGVAP